MNQLLRLTVLLLVSGALGCSSEGPRGAAGPPIQLTATLASPVDIDLEWKDTVPGAAGHVVEWTADLKEDYVILATLPPDVTSFRHPNLMPQAACHYRVRAYYGPVSNSVEIVLPQGLSDAEYAARFEGEEDFSWGAPATAGAQAATKSIRDASTAAAAAPADLKGVLMPVTVSGFKLTWTDRASDEEGYLLEMKPDGSADYRVSAMTAPNINSFGYALAPPARKALVRIRAFYYGKPSNLESKTTGAEPSQSP